MDCLRYWVTEMHVDGFRFDLAATLARELLRVDRLSAFFDLIQQDPVVARSSSSPSPGTSARAATRSATSRRRGRSGTASTATPSATSGGASRPHVAELASRLTGSSRPLRVRQAAGPSRASTSSPPTTASRCATSSPTTRSTTRPTARTTATARRHNRSWNCGVEGPTDDPAVLACRAAPAAQLPGHAAALAGRADAAGRRRVRPHPARQQQRLLPGQRDLLVRLGDVHDQDLLAFTAGW